MTDTFQNKEGIDKSKFLAALSSSISLVVGRSVGPLVGPSVGPSVMFVKK